LHEHQNHKNNNKKKALAIFLTTQQAFKNHILTMFSTCGIAQLFSTTPLMQMHNNVFLCSLYQMRSFVYACWPSVSHVESFVHWALWFTILHI